MEQMNILNRTLDELRSDMLLLGAKPFRADQVFYWLYKGVCDFDQMTNIPRTLIDNLKLHYHISAMEVTKRLESSDRQTIKYLFLLADHNIIECVAMEYSHGVTLCLSTQIGCRMGCSFCASTHGGLVRNLEAGEMVSQLLQVNNDLLRTGRRSIGGFVLMGSGEPLDNYANTLKFLRLVHEPKGLNMSYRNMTLSTCGLVPGMLALAEEDIPINLAVSLHASNNDVRRKLMPVAAAYSIEQVVDTARTYFEQTGRRVTFEYAMIRDINDQRTHAKELVALLKGFPCHVNIIPLNEGSQQSLKRSNEEAIGRFMNDLIKAGVNVTRRRELGLDIEGACGQLRASYLDKDEKQGG